jgi:hypothetical protein
LRDIEAAEQLLAVEDLIERAMAEAAVEDFQFPMVGSKTPTA